MHRSNYLEIFLYNTDGVFCNILEQKLFFRPLEAGFDAYYIITAIEDVTFVLAIITLEMLRGVKLYHIAK